MKEILERLDVMQSSLERLEHTIDAGFARAGQRLDQAGRRVERMDHRFGRAEAQHQENGERPHGVERRFDTLETQMQRRTEMLEGLLADTQRLVAAIFGSREAMELRFAELNRKLDARSPRG